MTTHQEIQTPAVKQRVRLSAVADEPREKTDVYVHQDGRVFVAEKAWRRLSHDDPRVAKAALTDIRGSIDIAPLKVVGVAFRSPKRGHVEVTVVEAEELGQKYEGVLWRDGQPCASATSTRARPRQLANRLLEGRIGILVAPPVTDTEVDFPQAYICPQCGNTGKIDIGACQEPRCISERSKPQPARRRLVHD